MGYKYKHSSRKPSKPGWYWTRVMTADGELKYGYRAFGNDSWWSTNGWQRNADMGWRRLPIQETESMEWKGPSHDMEQPSPGDVL